MSEESVVTRKYILPTVVWCQLNSIKRPALLTDRHRCIYRMSWLHVIWLWFALGFNVGLMGVIKHLMQRKSLRDVKRTNCGECLLGFITAQYCNCSPQISFLFRFSKMDFWLDSSRKSDIESGALFTNNVWFTSVHLFSKSIRCTQNCL